MGGGSWSDEAHDAVSRARATSSVHETFKARAVHATLDPKKLVVRESRDSADHPNSNAVMVFFDVTGSMGEIPNFFAKQALGKLMRELLEKLPCPDPQLCVGAIGDAFSDRSPLQVGQFESDNRIDDWLTNLFVEGGGGGGNHESYGLAYLTAGKYTSIDCFEKRGQKGFLFVIGDEAGYDKMSADELAKVFGPGQHEDVTLEQAISAARQMYDVYHIVVRSGQYPTESNTPYWRRYLGQHVLVLEDYKALAELIVTTISISYGMSVDKATAGFDSKVTDLVLRSGVKDIATRPSTGEIARLV